MPSGRRRFRAAIGRGAIGSPSRSDRRGIATRWIRTGAWPLSSLRQSFLNGALTRLLDPDAVLKQRIAEFVRNGDFGLASGPNHDGTYQRVWFGEQISIEEVAFEAGVVLLKRDRGEALKAGTQIPSHTVPFSEPESPTNRKTEQPTVPTPEPPPRQEKVELRVAGSLPPELWNRLGTRLLPRLRSGDELHIGVDIKVRVKSELVSAVRSDLSQAIEDLGLGQSFEIH